MGVARTRSLSGCEEEAVEFSSNQPNKQTPPKSDGQVVADRLDAAVAVKESEATKQFPPRSMSQAVRSRKAQAVRSRKAQAAPNRAETGGFPPRTKSCWSEATGAVPHGEQRVSSNDEAFPARGMSLGQGNRWTSPVSRGRDVQLRKTVEA